MARPRLTIPKVRLQLWVKPETLERIRQELYSEIEQRVPYGALEDFIEERLRDYFDSQSLDLAPFAGCDPGLFFVRGTPTSVKILEKTLKGEYSK